MFPKRASVYEAEERGGAFGHGPTRLQEDRLPVVPLDIFQNALCQAVGPAFEGRSMSKQVDLFGAV